MSNLIKIIPGLYIGSYYNGLENNMNITGNIISINKQLNNKMKILNIEVDPTNLYLKNKLHSELINYDLINKFIIESYINKENTIIYSDDIIIVLIICIEFLIKYLDLDIIEAISIVSNKSNINPNKLPKNQIFEIFNRYTKKKS